MKTDASSTGKKFWQPPAWKWIVVLVLLALAAFLLFRKPAARPVKVELVPFTDSPPPWDGSYPYLLISLTADSKNAANPSAVQFKSSISLVQPTLRHDSPVNEFAVDLHTGKFLLRQTDLFVPDEMPLSLTRTYAVWGNNRMAFGVGTNHPYDIAPTGSRFPYTYMNINLEDGRQVYFSRVSKGTGYADAVFRHSATSSEFYGAQVAWNGNGWTLGLKDGRQVIFPDSYNATSYAQGAPTEIRDAAGRGIQMTRDHVGNLIRLLSPSGHTIIFKYDDLNRIVEADDDAGNVRNYTYSYGHLSTVSDRTHVLYKFDYEILLQSAGYDPYLMTSIRDGNDKELLRNWYADGARVSMQRLGDGETFRYDYLFNHQHNVVETVVTLPDKSEKRFLFENGVMVTQK